MGTDIWKEVSAGQYERIGFVDSDEGVNQKVQEKIAEQYSNADENKWKRLAISAIIAGKAIPSGFSEYDVYVENCRIWGEAQKQGNAERLTNCRIIKRGDENIYVE
jgi:hypothetical protein